MGKHDRAYIRAICRKLRRQMTPAEQRFWAMVRNRQLCGKKFNRQYPITFELEGSPGFFVADFYCHECKLVVEIDGGIHETQKQYDELRTYLINSKDIRVIRFSNEQILQRGNEVEAALRPILTHENPSNGEPF